jgi:protein-S-isoprenylcysteine O-methyltransferase Ste14
LGVVLVVATARLLAQTGDGTLAPWDPTQKLITHAVYARVWNPMISRIVCIRLGVAILFGSLPLLVWFLTFLVGNPISNPLVEERDLRRRFGDARTCYTKAVPRWIPDVRARREGGE